MEEVGTQEVARTLCSVSRSILTASSKLGRLFPFRRSERYAREIASRSAQTALVSPLVVMNSANIMAILLSWRTARGQDECSLQENCSLLAYRDSYGRAAGREMHQELNLRRALTRRKMKQSALASAIDVSPGFISEIVSGKKNPSMDTLRRIAEAIGCPISELYSGPQSSQSGGSLSFDAATIARIDNPDVNPSLIAGALGLTLSSPDMYSVSSACTAFSVLENDQIIVDPSTPPRDGDLVIGRHLDESNTGDTTTIYKKVGEHLMDGDPRSAPIMNYSNKIRLLGTVVTTIRKPNQSI